MGRPLFYRIFRNSPTLEKLRRVPDYSTLTLEQVRNIGRWFICTPRKTLPAGPDIPPAIRESARIAFSDRDPAPGVRPTTLICLCSDTDCPRKNGQRITLADCPRNAFGLCVDATIDANEGDPLNLPEIGFLVGFSKQRADQYVKQAQEEVILLALKDPAIREFLIEMGIRNPMTGSEIPRVLGE